ncbi:MAG: MBL fold metallo-hydrolase [Thermoanaerobaculia bacterium]|nr:MBL fold metallo-hydrolase [Thermoanaerobaculia bacterium]
MPRYRNTTPHPRQGLGGFLRWRWERATRRRTALAELPSPPHPLPVEPPSAPGLTWVGHATFLLDLGDATLLTDPHFSQRASPLGAFGPRRLVPPALALDDLPPLDLVLVSHNHYDHLDRPTMRRLAELGPPRRVVAPPGLGRKLQRWGLGATVELAWWEAHDVGDLRVHAVPVKHSSCRWGPDRDHTGWNGYVVEAGGRRFFFAGDTAYSDDFTTLRRRLGPVDLAALPIGAYEPRWFMRHVHASPEEAVQIHLDLGACRSVAMHWGTFPLTDEPIDEPPRRLARALDERGIDPAQFVVLRHGETLPLDAPPQLGRRPTVG